MADRIVVLRAGRVEQIGAPLDLYNRPANTFVAGFIGSPRMNFLPATVLSGLPNRPPRAHTFGIRPEHARIADAGPVQLQVGQVEQLGASSVLRGTVGEDTPFELVCAGQTGLRAGDRVPLALPADALHAFDADGLRLTWEGA